MTAWSAVLDVAGLLERATVDGPQVALLLQEAGVEQLTVTHLGTEHGATDAVTGMVRGRRGRFGGGKAPTLGLIGRLGGVGARPARTGYVSDGDGALAALSSALHLARLRASGDVPAGDVHFATHVCPRARIRPHHPVPYMISPLAQAQMNEQEVDPAMEAVLCFDTTRGNRLVNRRGIAITPTIKDGYILPVSEDLLDLQQNVTGRLPLVLPVSTQDVTPYENGLYHLNSLLQPAAATTAPVVGVAITAEAAVAGSATGASQLVDVEEAVRFGVEVANAYGEGRCAFFDSDEFTRLQELYGRMTHLQRPGGNRA